MENERPIRTLSFVESSDAGVNLWPAAPQGETYTELNDRGRARADETIGYVRDRAAPMALGYVTEAMIGAGKYGAMEIGFCSQVALHASR